MNLRKHGVHFADAEGVLFDPCAISVEDEQAEGEQRFATIGIDPASQILVVVYTYRGENIRLISARHATKKKGGAMKAEYDFNKGTRGAVVAQGGKTRITIYIDDDVLEAFRQRAEESCSGYQTLINQVLRASMADQRQPVDEDTLRRVIREELRVAG